jgi:23S rRNA-/tRNA-specific pseudouridylate synthase
MTVATAYRDRWIWVVEKPSGLPTQADRDGTEDLATLLRRDSPYVGVHHRLDRPASGLVLFTTDPAANRKIGEAFRTHAVERRYRAVLWGNLDTPTVWDAPLDGQPAVTRAEPIGWGQGLTSVELALETGRKHQIRLHAALAGLAVVGDRRYGGDAGRRWPRLALHASELTFDHPIDGHRVELRSELPADLAGLWIEAGGPPRA